MNNKILITGSQGFIGKNLVLSLKHKFDIEEISRKTVYDIKNLQSFSEIEKIDTVIHCAAKTFIPDSIENPFEFYQFNIQTSLNIAEFCRVKKIKKLIFINAYPYGNPIHLPVNENHQIEPHSPYSSSKYISEQLLFNYLSDFTKVISLRVFNLYGAFQPSHFLIPHIISQARKKNEIILNDLRPKRDFLYIKDFVELIIKILNSDRKAGIFNVGLGKSYHIQDIIDIISEFDGKKYNLKCLNIHRQNEVLDLFSDIKKVSTTFNWKPVYSLRKGIFDLLNYYENQK